MLISVRRRRLLRITSERWQRRGIFVLGGVAVGAAAVALAYLADYAQAAFNLVLAKSRYASLVVTPLGFALSVLGLAHCLTREPRLPSVRRHCGTMSLDFANVRETPAPRGLR